MKVNATKAGLIVGSFLGIWHLVWGLLVLMGVAQALLDFIFSIHFLSNPYIMQPFSFWFALELIIVTSALGFVVGWFFAFLWNYFHEKSANA